MARNPWRVWVKRRKRQERLDWGDVLVLRLMSALFLLPALVVGSALVGAPGAFGVWLLVVGVWALLSLIPGWRAWDVKLYNRKFDKRRLSDKA